MFVFWYFLPLFGQIASISIMVFTLPWAHASMSDQGTEGASSTGKGNMLGCPEHQETHPGGGAARTAAPTAVPLGGQPRGEKGAAHVPLEVSGDRSSCCIR
jgi:hypothetical protein